MPEAARRQAQSEPPMRELALGLTYPQSLERAGAMPVILPPLLPEVIDLLVARLDGLLLTGGPDLHPGTYGKTPHPALGPTEREIDAFELALIRAAERRGLPILAICRGMQALNVARGGTLVQDLPSERPGGLPHRQEEAGRVPTHPVSLAEGSRIARIAGHDRDRGQLLPSPGDRPSRRGPAPCRLGAGRRHRGRRGRRPRGSSWACSGTPRASPSPSPSRRTCSPRSSARQPTGRAWRRWHSGRGALVGLARGPIVAAVHGRGRGGGHAAPAAGRSARAVDRGRARRAARRHADERELGDALRGRGAHDRRPRVRAGRDRRARGAA